jgi:hypothetical protein
MRVYTISEVRWDMRCSAAHVTSIVARRALRYVLTRVEGGPIIDVTRMLMDSDVCE